MTEHAPHEQIATDTDDVVTTSEGTGEPHYGCAYGDGSNLPAGFDGIKHQCSVEYDAVFSFDFVNRSANDWVLLRIACVIDSVRPAFGCSAPGSLRVRIESEGRPL